MARFPLKEAEVMALVQAMVSGLTCHAFTARFGRLDDKKKIGLI